MMYNHNDFFGPGVELLRVRRGQILLLFVWERSGLLGEVC